MIVVDASVALSWVLPDTDEHHRFSAAVAQAGLRDGRQFIAPSIFHVECSYVLLRRGRAGRWGEARIAECAEVIDAFSVQPYAVQQSIAAQVRFAVRHHVQGYDALYLALALQAGADLATVDGGLRTAARSAGVKVFKADANSEP